ncbi:cupin [Rhodospirillaceae bacterium KN72]|uniref:Cupin n=1 Tax=Pacificispira spongiicola TaxID=2729598 RepID=A0A7Y0E1U5_9PROT|nr:cupin [Pacificispira spongiicola]NMM45641.1 cupin [Pacificispira spongiicola]
MLNPHTAEIDLPCSEIPETLAFFQDDLGFSLHTIYPADDPAVAILSGHGLRLRLVRGLAGQAGRIRLLSPDAEPREVRAPNGTVIEFAPLNPWPEIPANRPSFVYCAAPTEREWGTGRAGMQYRDLIPDRWGGRFIASHIRIPQGGPVPDYVHFHKVRFQMIFCYRGWVRLVYEDQGEPFILRAGDCVLQPPEIRHRVLEASDRLEVVEIGCPADHPTHVDHILPLPTCAMRPDRDFHGQRFVRHGAADALWEDWALPAFRQRDLGIAAATDGLAHVRVVERLSDRPLPVGQVVVAAEEFHFLFCTGGSARLTAEPGGAATLEAGASVALPPGTLWSFSETSPDLSFLEVCL